MIIPAKTPDSQRDLLPPASSVGDSTSLRLEMRASFHEVSERLTLLEIEQTMMANKFDALLAIIAESLLQWR